MFDALNNFFDDKANTQAESEGRLYSLSPSTPNVLDLFYKNLEKLGYNLDELKPALEQQGTSLVISCAGSGKTTFMELKLIHDYLSGELYTTKQISGTTQTVLSRVFVSTFLKTGAEELKTSFDEKCTELNVQGICSDAFTFSTLHSEYYQILHEIGVKMTIATEEESASYLTRACRALNIKSKSKGYGEPLKDELSDLACIVTYARNRIDDKRYKHPLCEEYSLTPAVLDKLIEMMGKYRKAENKYDFEDLQELIFNGIQTNPAFAQMIGSRYAYVFIDEFQDTSQVQYEILKTYINGARKTIAIGDDDQCIYSWRGSDINIITTNFRQDYNPAIHKFTVNYRCRANILSPVIPSIKLNSNRYDKDLSAYKPGGVVIIKNTCDVNALMDEVKYALSQQFTVGILSRTNFDLLAPAILLELDNTIPFSLSKAVSINSYIPKQVLGCIKLLTRRYTNDFEGYLKPFCGRYNEREARMLADILVNQPELSLTKLTDEDLAYSCKNLWINLFKPIREIQNPIDQYDYMLKYLAEKHYTGDSPFALRARLFISFVRDLIKNHSLFTNLDIDDIDELLTDTIPNRLSKRAYSKKGTSNARVRLTTVHEAKGKEWQSVIIWNDTAGVFPAQVGKRIITADEMEEERRLHYIAFTRAKERLTVFTSELKPSPFLGECQFDAQLSAKTDDTEVKSVTFVSKSVTPLVDAFQSTLADFMVSTDTQLSSKALNLSEYYSYNTDTLVEKLREAHKLLTEQGALSGAGGNFVIELEWCIDFLLYKIMEQAQARMYSEQGTE